MAAEFIRYLEHVARPDEPDVANIGGYVINLLLESELGEEFIDESSRAFSNLPLYFGLTRELLHCGASHAVLARLLAQAIDVPLQQGGDGPHVELAVKYYSPESGDLAHTTDHTYITYWNNPHDGVHIDAMAARMWGGAVDGHDDTAELILSNTFFDGRHYYDELLAEQYRLFKYDEHTPPDIMDHPYSRSDFRTLEELKHLVGIMHVPDITDLPPSSWREPAADLFNMLSPRWSPEYITDVLLPSREEWLQDRLRTRPSYYVAYEQTETAFMADYMRDLYEGITGQPDADRRLAS